MHSSDTAKESSSTVWCRTNFNDRNQKQKKEQCVKMCNKSNVLKFTILFLHVISFQKFFLATTGFQTTSDEKAKRLHTLIPCRIILLTPNETSASSLRI